MIIISYSEITCPKISKNYLKVFLLFRISTMTNPYNSVYFYSYFILHSQITQYMYIQKEIFTDIIYIFSFLQIKLIPYFLSLLTFSSSILLSLFYFYPFIIFLSIQKYILLS